MKEVEQLYCMPCRVAGRNGSCRQMHQAVSLCACSKAAVTNFKFEIHLAMSPPAAAAASSVSFLAVCGLQLHI